jgi:glycosyltransferase involved in cell wall biosynthesis
MNQLKRSNKKLLLVTSNFTLGGTERSVFNLFKLLHDEGFDVKLLRFYKRLHTEYTADFEYDSLNVNARGNKIIRFILLQIRLICFLNNKRDFQIVLYNNKFLIFFLFPILLFRNKLILSDRSNYTNRNFLHKYLYKLCLNFFVDRMVVQTEYMKSRYEGELKYNKVGVLQNFISKDDFQYISSKNSPSLNKIIYTTGRLIPSKNHEKIIRAFAIHSQSHLWELSIFGQGPLESSLYSLISELKLEDRIKIRTGNIESMSQCGIFVFLSESEGFPNALQEALYSCIPSIVYKYNDSLNEIIKDSETVILEDLTIHKIGTALKNLVEKMESDPYNVFKHYKSMYDAESMVDIERKNIEFYSLK